MKKVLATIVAIMLTTFGFSAVGRSNAGGNASCHFVPGGGLSIDRFSKGNVKTMGKPGWHAGASVLVKMPAYFSIQPGVWFERTYSNVYNYSSLEEMRTDYITVPIPVQWGPDLGFCRLFVQGVPFVDFPIAAKTRSNGGGWTEDVKEFFKAAQFGVGVGGGLEIWRLQISARYNWHFGDWKSTTSSNPFRNMDKLRQSITVTAAIVF